MVYEVKLRFVCLIDQRRLYDRFTLMIGASIMIVEIDLGVNGEKIEHFLRRNLVCCRFGLILGLLLGHLKLILLLRHRRRLLLYKLLFREVFLADRFFNAAIRVFLLDLAQLSGLAQVSLIARLDAAVISSRRRYDAVVVLWRAEDVHFPVLAWRHTGRFARRYRLAAKNVKFTRVKVRLVRVEPASHVAEALRRVCVLLQNVADKIFKLGRDLAAHRRQHFLPVIRLF